MTVTLMDTMRKRRANGASVKDLAAEVGVTWQRLDKALRHGTPLQGATLDPEPSPRNGTSHRAVTALLEPGKTGSLTERYRPRTLNGIWGQEAAVRFLKKFAAKPYPAAFLFEGETGTGKTSAALCLAAAIGVPVEVGEFGGLYTVASGEQSADGVRAICDRVCHIPMMGSGWKVVVVNEVDRMHLAAETIWLDALEQLPFKTVIIFTTNDNARLTGRFRDRCIRLKFESDARKQESTGRAFAEAIWKREAGKKPDPETIAEVVREATEGRQISFRRIVQSLNLRLP